MGQHEPGVPLPFHKYCPYDGTLLVCITEHGQPRPICSKCGYVDYQNPRPAVAVIVCNDAHQLLLARRAAEPRKGHWDIPGGFMEPHESAEQAARREIAEETGLTLGDLQYLGSLPDVYGPQGVPTINLCFLARVVDQTPRASDDAAELAWFDCQRLPEQMAFAHQAVMLRWACGRLTNRGL